MHEDLNARIKRRSIGQQPGLIARRRRAFNRPGERFPAMANCLGLAGGTRGKDRDRPLSRSLRGIVTANDSVGEGLIVRAQSHDELEAVPVGKLSSTLKVHRVVKKIDVGPQPGKSSPECKGPWH